MSCKFASFGCKVQGVDMNKHESECPYKFIEENEKLKQQLKVEGGTVDFKTCLVDKYAAVIERLKKGAANVVKFSSYLKNQHGVYETYGKHLSTTLYPVEHLGELTTPNHSILLFSHAIGGRYLHVANQIEGSMIRDLTNLNNEITKVIASSQKKEKINRSEYEAATALVKQTKTEDMKRKLNCNTKTEESLKKGTLDIKGWAANYNLVEESESDYKIAVMNQQYTDKLFHDFMREELDRLEKLDRKRIELVKRVLIDYKELFVEISKVHKERVSAMQKAIGEIDSKKDVQDFILSVKSGNARDPPMTFEPYQVKFPDN
jgi:hypothetical protein